MGFEFDRQRPTPEQKAARDAKLKGIYAMGQKLADAADKTHFVFPDHHDGPKAKELALHAESLVAGGLGEEFIGGKVLVYDAFTSPETFQEQPDLVEISLSKSYQVEDIVRYQLDGPEKPEDMLHNTEAFTVPSKDSDTVIETVLLYINDPETPAPETTHPYLEEHYEDWPLEVGYAHEDMQGHSVLPVWKASESKLVDNVTFAVRDEGWDMIKNVLKEEAKIRNIDLEK